MPEDPGSDAIEFCADFYPPKSDLSGFAGEFRAFAFIPAERKISEIGKRRATPILRPGLKKRGTPIVAIVENLVSIPPLRASDIHLKF